MSAGDVDRLPGSGDRSGSGTDDLSALTARIEAIDVYLQTTREIVDEKSLKELRRTIDSLSKRDPKFEERVTNKVDVMADRVETVAKTVSTTSAALAAKDGEIVQLRRELQAAVQQVDTSLRAAARGADPAELVELRRALDDLAKTTRERMPRGLEGRIEELAAKFTLVGQRVDSLSATVSETAGGLSGREGELNALRRSFEAETGRINAELAEQRRANDPRTVMDLRDELKELAAETARKQHATRQLIGQSATKLDAVSEQLDSLTTSLTSTSDRVSTTEQHLLALRAYLEESRASVNALFEEHRQALATLTSRTAAFEESNGDLAERVDSLGAAVSSTAERLDAREVAVEALEHRFTEATTRVDELVGALGQALAEFPDPSSAAEELTPRIDDLAEQTALLARQLARVESSADEQRRTSASASAELSRRLDALASSLAPVAEDAAARVLDERVGDVRHELERLAHRLEALDTTTASSAARASGTEEAVAELRAYVEEAGGRLNSLLAEHKQSLALLDARTAVLEKTDDETARILEDRVSAANTRVDELGSQLNSLATNIESAVLGLTEREHELMAAHSHFADSSSRVETIAEDIREALSAFAELGAEATEDLAARVERIEKNAHESAAARERAAEELARRIDFIDKRVATVATEVARAKTLWPVALRSLEARLDDVSHARRTEPSSLTAHAPAMEPADDSDDLLAGLRDSLHAMETVAAEMARASDALGPAEAEDGPDASGDADAPVAAAGATVVPLRTAEP